MNPTSSAGMHAPQRQITHTRMEEEDVQKEYEYGEIIGEGSFGKVYKAKHSTSGETVAIKEIVKEKAGSSGLKQLEKEVTIFKKVDHKNIIKLKEVIESPKKMFLVMELCRGGDLAKLLQKRSHLSEEDTKCVMGNLAQAIKYLHQQGILHRDLKLENILLADDPDENGPIEIKVSDFGLSTQQNNNSYENMQEQYCGTPSYMAPEMTSTYSHLVDVWAMGLIMYYLLTSYPKDNELNEAMATNGPVFKEQQWSCISQPAKELLKEILNPNPAHRLSTAEVLNHEWFTGKKREYPNVLQLMKEFKQEQDESKTAEQDGTEKVDDGKVENSAINGVDGNTSTEKRGSKGSAGKKGSISESITPPGSGVKSSKNKLSIQPATSQRYTGSKTPTLKSTPTKAEKAPASAAPRGANNNSKTPATATTSHSQPTGLAAKSTKPVQTNPKLKKK